MTQKTLRKLAKQGNVEAIALLLQVGLQTQGLTVKAAIQKWGLLLFLESDEIPEEQASVNLIRQNLMDLGLNLFRLVKIYGRRRGKHKPDWNYEFEIETYRKPHLPKGCKLRKGMNPDKSEIKKLVVQYIFEVYITEAPKLRAVLWGAVVLLGMYTMMFALDTKLSIESKITVISLYSCLICVFFIPRVFTWPPYFDISNFWIIEYNKKIVAFGELKKGSKVFTIRKLFVTSAWRRRGLGSALVKHFMEETNQPLHVVSCPKLAKFYTQLGFVPSQSSNGTIKLVYEDKWIDAEPG